MDITILSHQIKFNEIIIVLSTQEKVEHLQVEKVSWSLHFSSMEQQLTNTIHKTVSKQVKTVTT